MHRILAILLACLACPAVAQTAAPPRLARSQTFHRDAAAGAETRIFTYAGFRRDCQASPPPQLTIDRPPAHGTVSIRPMPSTVTVLREGAPDCLGHTYDGTALFYVPTPGFHGPDRLEWTVDFGTTMSHDRAEIAVR